MSDGRLLLISLEAAYLRIFGTAIQPAVYGYQSVMALLTSISHTVLIKGKPPKRYIILNKELSSKLLYTIKLSIFSTNTIFIYLIGVGIALPNSIMKSPTPDQCEKNQGKPVMNHEDSFSENISPIDENKVCTCYIINRKL